MDSILGLVLPLSDLLGTPAVPTALVSLLLLGAAAHLLIRKLVQKLGSFADTTAARWDDVVYYAISSLRALPCAVFVDGVDERERNRAIRFREARQIKLPQEMRLQSLGEGVSVREVDILTTRALSCCSRRRRGHNVFPRRIDLQFRSRKINRGRIREVDLLFDLRIERRFGYNFFLVK